MKSSSRRSPFASFRRHPLALAISALLLGGAVITDAAAQAIPATFAVSGLNGSNGFRLDGVASGDVAAAVSRAGDINGDGIGDVIIGASDTDRTGDGADRAPAAAASGGLLSERGSGAPGVGECPPLTTLFPQTSGRHDGTRFVERRLRLRPNTFSLLAR